MLANNGLLSWWLRMLRDVKSGLHHAWSLIILGILVTTIKSGYHQTTAEAVHILWSCDETRSADVGVVPCWSSKGMVLRAGQRSVSVASLILCGDFFISDSIHEYHSWAAYLKLGIMNLTLWTCVPALVLMDGDVWTHSLDVRSATAQPLACGIFLPRLSLHSMNKKTMKRQRVPWSAMPWDFKAHLRQSEHIEQNFKAWPFCFNLEAGFFDRMWSFYRSVCWPFGGTIIQNASSAASFTFVAACHVGTSAIIFCNTSVNLENSVVHRIYNIYMYICNGILDHLSWAIGNDHRVCRPPVFVGGPCAVGAAGAFWNAGLGAMEAGSLGETKP